MGNQRVSVGVADLLGLGCLIGRDEFVSGSDDGDAASCKNRNGGDSDGREQGHFAVTDPGSLWEHEGAVRGFAPAEIDELAARGVAVVNHERAFAANVLHHYDGVSALRNGSAGHNLDGLAGENGAVKSLSRAHFSYHADAARHVRGANREAVTRGAIECRIGAIGVHVAGQHAPRSGFERRRFKLWHGRPGRHFTNHDGARFLVRDSLRWRGGRHAVIVAGKLGIQMPFRSSLLVMAQMVRDRRISPVELIDSHLRRIEAQNPRINAFVCVLADEAREAARQSERAVMRGETLRLLHGVPVTVKDSFDMAGLPTYCGSQFRKDHRATQDSTAAARFRANGAIILGKTNAPEFLAMYETDNFITGRTNNPWDLSKTAGGSSGGESAAIAAFCSAGGIGSDGGGSIRIPAHFCGIAGLKPTPGRVPATGHFPAISHPGGLLGVGGPMARSAQDVRLLFAVLAGHDPEDPFSAPVPLRPPGTEAVRIGVWEQFYGTPVGPDIASTLSKAAACAREIGLGAVDFTPVGLERAQDLWWLFFGRIYAPLTRTMIAGREDEAHWTGTELMHRALAQPTVSTLELLGAMGARDRMRTALLRQMEASGIAAILMPVCATAAFAHGQRHYPVNGGATIELLEAMAPVTPWNLLGMPAMVIPFGMTPNGLPVGVQIVGRPWDEETILDIAVRLEQARGVFPSPPEA